MRRLAVLAFAAACGGAAPAPTPPPPTSNLAAGTTLRLPLMRTRVNNTDLHFRLAGDSTATPVVFVHGSTGNLDNWSNQLGAFVAKHRVVVYSRRYHPPNAARDDGQVYTPGLHAEDLAALIEGLNLGPAHIVGSSYGAFVAIDLALERPDLVRSLVLGEPPILPFLLRTPEGDSLRRVFESRALDPARAAFRRGDSVEAMRRFVDGVGGAGRFDNLVPAARDLLLRAAFELRRELQADPREYMPALACNDLGRLATPILLLKGDRSPRMFHLITDQLERCLNTETVTIVPGAGHAIHSSNPSYYNQVVLQYLASH